MSSNTTGWIHNFAIPVIVFAAFMWVLILVYRKANRGDFGGVSYVGSFFWEHVSEKWLTGPNAITLFAAAVAFILAVTVVGIAPDRLTGLKFPDNPGTLFNIMSGILGVLYGLCILYLWGGMRRFWIEHHPRSRRGRSLWGAVLTFGMWFGAILYFLAFYLPAMKSQHRSLHG